MEIDTASPATQRQSMTPRTKRALIITGCVFGAAIVIVTVVALALTLGKKKDAAPSAGPGHHGGSPAPDHHHGGSPAPDHHHGGSPAGPPPEGVLDIADQPASSVYVYNNTSDAPLYVYMAVLGGKSWSVNKSLSSGGSLTAPTEYGPSGDKPANDVGSGTFQVLTLNKAQGAVLNIPDFPKGEAFRITALRYNGDKPCTGGDGCGMPILIEVGKDMVGNMSAVAGVNYLVKYALTTPDGVTVIDMKGNPCTAIGKKAGEGCVNPSVDGIFKKLDKCMGAMKNVSNACDVVNTEGHCWCNEPCRAGTCNLAGDSLKWCDAIHTGQCANSKSTWEGKGVSPDCAPKNRYTTYCYSHDDANSSPPFGGDYKINIVYGDL